MPVNRQTLFVFIRFSSEVLKSGSRQPFQVCAAELCGIPRMSNSAIPAKHRCRLVFITFLQELESDATERANPHRQAEQGSLPYAL
jgi:hypothetical protein